jgi:hypothetical protein
MAESTEVRRLVCASRHVAGDGFCGKKMAVLRR